MIAQPCRTPKARHALSGVCVIDILDILAGIAGEEADARALPLPDGPMRSLATLGVPPIHPGDVAGGIPLSRLTDVVWHDANDLTPLAQSSHSESTIPLSRLTDVLWRGPSAVVPGEQDNVSGASMRAWNDSGATDHAAMQPWPSLDPRSRDWVAPIVVSEQTSIPQPQGSGRWGDNVPRIVVTPRRPWTTPEDGAEIFSSQSAPQSYPSAGPNVDRTLADDRLYLREQVEPPPEAAAPTYDGSGNLTGDRSFTFGDDVEDRLVSASGPGVIASDVYDAEGWLAPKIVNGATPFVTDADNREILKYDGGSGAPRRQHAYGRGPNDALNQMNVAPRTPTTSFAPDIRAPIIATVDSGAGALTNIGYTPYGASGRTSGTFRYTGQPFDPGTRGDDYDRARAYRPAWGRFTQVNPISPPSSGWASSPWSDARATLGGTDSAQVDVATVWRSPTDESSGAIQPAAMLHDELQRLLFGQGELFGGGGWQAPGAPILPPFIRKGPTSGVLRSPGKADIPLVSVYGGAPASRMPQGAPGFDLLGRSHVEGHAAATMREQGMKQGTLYINNPKICDSCTKNLPAMLPPGATLDVVLPNGTYYRFIGAVR